MARNRFGLDVDIWFRVRGLMSSLCRAVKNRYGRGWWWSGEYPDRVDAETYLGRKGVLVIPDFIANAGGVIRAVELRRGTPEESGLLGATGRFAATSRRCWKEAKSEGILPRLELAENNWHAVECWRR